MIPRSVLFLTVKPFGAGRFRKPDLLMPAQLDYEVTYVQPLRRVFADVSTYDFWTDYVVRGPAKANRGLVECVKSTLPSYVVWPARMYEVFESTLLGLADAGAIVVGWFFDDDLRFHDYTAGWLPYLDYCMTHQKGALQAYRAAGARAFHLIPGANADVYMPLKLDLRYDVTFAGRHMPHRVTWLAEFARGGISAQAFGRGFPSGFLSTPDLVRLFNESRINLCLSRSYRDGGGVQLKARVFEICMSGGFCLCEWTPDLEEYFDVGREIEAFRTVSEAVEKARFYLDDEACRTAIAHAGLERAQRCYREDLLLGRVFNAIEEDRRSPHCHRRRSVVPGASIHSAPNAASWHAGVSRGLLMNAAPRDRWLEEARLALEYAPRNAEALRLLRLRALPHRIATPALQLSELLDQLRGALARGKHLVRECGAFARHRRSSRDRRDPSGPPNESKGAAR